MAVVYMKKLENEPETYHAKFTSLTKGVNILIQDRIVENIHESDRILEIGCGPGILAKRMASQGCEVTGLDINPKMIKTAQKLNDQKNLQLQFFQGNALTLEKSALLDSQPTFILKSPLSITLTKNSTANTPIKKVSTEEKYTKIVSTFMLSELRPLEQQIFLRNAWKKLHKDGEMFLAAEFVPKRLARVKFNIERWYFKKKMKRTKTTTNPLKNFTKYLKPIGFTLKNHISWKNGAIQLLHLQKVQKKDQIEPGYYTPPQKSFKGIEAWLRSMRCLLTGQVDHVPIEPGIYKSGSPNKTSPILVTANYDYTYIKLMQKIKHTDAWVLCVDSRGINVWCAARGNDFGNQQIIEAVEATNISQVTDSRKLILPQLSAGGVAIPELPKKNSKFPFTVVYGPVWAKDTEDYLKLVGPKKKPEKMKRAHFSLKHRFRAGITHTMFLYRKIFLSRLILFAILMGLLPFIRAWWFLGEFLLYVLIINAIITFGYPLSTFTRNFILKGFFFGIINIIIISLFSGIFHGSFIFPLWNIILVLWLSIFSTMSFSGYTFDTGPNEIELQYDNYQKISRVLLIGGVGLSLVGLFLFIRN
ncbi:Ubiquinone biosynthesis O-methyltransferase, mitochondrial [Candidatus Lokiarchaeum ossiferum]|uniref:Ubiquinone biosynthesis O-methyltransferase, mitochondrial n=1 Tax=Candidatus Lokiarchaeum ossiferum TaxID=2951803 RepID=A0ABY6HNI7_9ARCH|nr:Ubiquinone biosynthesis O-methyltransferase, mitochondrial [Candidatus Lokiarchaeum sp. B-35]